MAKKLKIVCIGNSITNGFPYKRSQSFPSLIREATGYEVINKGNNGESTGDVLARFKHDVLDHKPDVVTIMSGTNDFIYQLDTPEASMEKIKTACQMAIEAGIRVVLMTSLLTDAASAQKEWMTGADVNYEDVNKQIAEFADLMRKYAEEGRVTLVDTQKAYPEFVEKVGIEAAFHDGLHPTPEGYKFLASKILEVL